MKTLLPKFLSLVGLFVLEGTLSAVSGAVYTVDRLSDANPGGGGEGSGLVGDLRYCIDQANGAPGRDVVKFRRSLTGTVNLNGTLSALTGELIIRGPGADRVTVDGLAGTVITVATDATVALSGLTITGGGGNGGGVFTFGGSKLMLTNVTIIGNAAPAGGVGGGIWNYIDATVTLNGCTVSDNSALPNQYGLGWGGGIANYGTLRVNNSTFSGNTANFGGAIYNGGIATVYNSTITDNSAFGGSAGISNGGTLHSRDTIIAGNDGTDISGDLGSLGHNLIGNSAGGSGYDASDLLDIDPLLGPLQDNGGPTLTHALLPGSPAIDAGDNTNAPRWDQRASGFPRIVNGTIDIGAFEVQ